MAATAVSPLAWSVVPAIADFFSSSAAAIFAALAARVTTIRARAHALLATSHTKHTTKNRTCQGLASLAHIHSDAHSLHTH